MGNLAQLGHVGDAQQGVVHRLGVDHLRIGMGGKSLLHGLKVLHVDKGRLDIELLQVVGHEGKCAAIGSHAGHNVVARIHLVEQSAGDGCQSRTCYPSHLGAFHSGQCLAESQIGGVPVAAVEEVAFGFAVESLGHQMSFGECECGTVADGWVNAAV